MFPTLQERVTEIRQILEKYPPFPPTLKALLAKLHGFPLWPVRPPLVEVPPELLEKVIGRIFRRLSDERSLAPGHHPSCPRSMEHGCRRSDPRRRGPR